MAKKKLTLTQRVNILEKENRLTSKMLGNLNLRLVDLESPPSNEEEHPKEWRPQDGDLFRASDGRLCIAVKVDDEGAITYTMADGSKGGWMGCLVPVTKPSAAEITAHKEALAYSDRKGLLLYDAVECAPAQQEELKAIARAGGIKVLNDSPEYRYSGGQNLRYDKWCADGPFIIQTSAPDDVCFMEPLKWIPFPIFKKLLLLEVDRLKKEREEQEAKALIEWGTKVNLTGSYDTPGEFHAIYVKPHTGQYHMLIDEHGTTIYRTRGSFSVLPANKEKP